MQEATIKILVVDDDPSLLNVLEASLSAAGDFDVTACLNAGEAAALIDAQAFDLVVTDYSLNHPQYNGLDILRRARQRPETLVIIITAFASLEITLESIKLGAFDFLTKPFQLDELQLVVRNAAERSRLSRENLALRTEIARLAASVAQLEREHRAWAAQWRQLAEALQANQAFDASGGAENAAASSAGANSNVPRRRQIEEQITSYMRIGETLHERLSRERDKLESLFQDGLLPEELYQRALRTAKSGQGAQ